MPLFWYKLIFMGELILSEALATYTLKKKPYFCVRIISSIVICMAIAFLYPLFRTFYNAVYISIMFIVLFAVTATALKFCFAEPMKNIIFCAVTAYTTQHIAYSIYWFVLDITQLGTFNVYELTSEFNSNVFTAICYAGIYSIVYWFVWAFLEFHIRSQEDLNIGQFRLAIIAFIIIIVDIILNTINIYAHTALPTDVKIAMFIYDLLSCFLSIGILFSILEKEAAEKDLEIVEQLWERDKKWYKTNMLNVEMINAKCHDLKKQIRIFGEKNNIFDGEDLKELESVINIYDCAVKTGNEIIDLVIAEKSLICEKQGIDLSVIANGNALSFMNKSELFSLIENALSNAIECCIKIENREERFVRLHIKEQLGIAIIHVENPCKKEPEFIDGLPKTSKEDKNSHGFGMRSMQLIANKYGGGLNASYNYGMFLLDIAIPLQSRQK